MSLATTKSTTMWTRSNQSNATALPYMSVFDEIPMSIFMPMVATRM